MRRSVSVKPTYEGVVRFPCGYANRRRRGQPMSLVRTIAHHPGPEVSFRFNLRKGARTDGRLPSVQGGGFGVRLHGYDALAFSCLGSFRTHLVVGNDLDSIVLPDTHAAVGGAEVDSDRGSVRHVVCICFSLVSSFAIHRDLRMCTAVFPSLFWRVVGDARVVVRVQSILISAAVGRRRELEGWGGSKPSRWFFFDSSPPLSLCLWLCGWVGSTLARGPCHSPLGRGPCPSHRLTGRERSTEGVDGLGEEQRGHVDVPPRPVHGPGGRHPVPMLREGSKDAGEGPGVNNTVRRRPMEREKRERVPQRKGRRRLPPRGTRRSPQSTRMSAQRSHQRSRIDVPTKDRRGDPYGNKQPSSAASEMEGTKRIDRLAKAEWKHPYVMRLPRTNGKNA